MLAQNLQVGAHGRAPHSHVPHSHAPIVPGQRRAQAYQIIDDIDLDWERVLDCGALGPGRDGPALFHQPPANPSAMPPARAGIGDCHA